MPTTNASSDRLTRLIDDAAPVRSAACLSFSATKLISIVTGVALMPVPMLVCRISTSISGISLRACIIATKTAITVPDRPWRGCTSSGGRLRSFWR